MSKLYSKLARIYHEMYQSIFDYKKEFQFYNRWLKKYKVHRVLEIGCGSGNLAPYFLTKAMIISALTFPKKCWKSQEK